MPAPPCFYCCCSVPTYERQIVRSGRHLVGDDHEEDRHGQQRGDAHGDLLSGVGRHVEAEQRHQRDEQTGYHHVEDVEERTALDEDVIVDEDVGLRAAGEDHLLLEEHRQVSHLHLNGTFFSEVCVGGGDEGASAVYTGD